MDLVTIRPAGPGDLGALREVYRLASLSNAGDRAALLAEPEVLLFDGQGVAEGRTGVAVAADGAVLGFVTSLLVGDAMELEDLFVHPRSMRRGVGRLLVEDVVETAGRQGVHHLLVTANPHATAFYEAVGFVPDGVAQTRFGPAARMRIDVPGRGRPAIPGTATTTGSPRAARSRTPGEDH